MEEEEFSCNHLYMFFNYALATRFAKITRNCQMVLSFSQLQHHVFSFVVFLFVFALVVSAVAASKTYTPKLHMRQLQ